MKVLAIDIGSSSVKAAILRGAGAPKEVAREAYTTRYAGDQVDVPAEKVLRALRAAIGKLGPAVRQVDLIAPTGMSPSWLALDARGRPLTPIVTHQDRRSRLQAERIERSIGRRRHLRIAGNRPVPGGISLTTCAWFLEHQPALKRRIALIGHLNTWLAHLLCGTRVIDPSNASFTGLYQTTTLGGWHDDLVAAAGVKPAWLAEVKEGNCIAGHCSVAGARRLGLQHGTPMLAGVIDGSCAMLLAGATPRQVVHVVGSTDVLAVCTDQAKPFEGLLTRALGVGRSWLSVGTIAAAGSAVDWAHDALFADLSVSAYRKRVAQLARRPMQDDVVFDARIAGSRTEVEPIAGALSRLTLGTSREMILSALLESLATQSAERFDRFNAAGVRYGRDLFTTGGGAKELSRVLCRDWPGRWKRRSASEATARGLWVLAQQAKND
ncbi:MAG: xylulokinase [Tepidisphaeraceae bacterium]